MFDQFAIYCPETPMYDQFAIADRVLLFLHKFAIDSLAMPIHSIFVSTRMRSSILLTPSLLT